MEKARVRKADGVVGHDGRRFYSAKGKNNGIGLALAEDHPFICNTS